MIENIKVVIGENASGKTRYCLNILKNAKKHNLETVTNLEEFRSFNSSKRDELKVENIQEIGNRLFNAFMQVNRDDTILNRMFNLITLKGDVLVIDEVDMNLTMGEIISLMTAISDSKNCWKAIYLTGYNSEIGRVFVDVDKETYDEEYKSNYIMVDNDLKERKISEEEAYEYFNSL